MKKILLTGGCGYIGTVLAQKILERGDHVTIVDTQWFGNYHLPHCNLKILKADIRDINALPIRGMDAILHLASVANDPCVELDPKLSWEVNTLAPMLMADKAARAGVQQFIFASSGSVYGVKEELQVIETVELEPISEYNKTKMVTERALLSYSKDMIIQCIRPGTVCGVSPRMRLDVVVNMLTMQALTKKEITILGGDQVRPNIHIEDMVGVYLHMLDQGSKLQGIFNASFENLTVSEIARRIAAKIPAEIITRDSNDPRSYRMNSDKLLASGFIPQKNVEKAVEEIAFAYQSDRLKDKESSYNVKWMKKTVVLPAGSNC